MADDEVNETSSLNDSYPIDGDENKTSIANLSNRVMRAHECSNEMNQKTGRTISKGSHSRSTMEAHRAVANANGAPEWARVLVELAEGNARVSEKMARVSEEMEAMRITMTNMQSTVRAIGKNVTTRAINRENRLLKTVPFFYMIVLEYGERVGQVPEAINAMM
jgi:hypothetical protein